MTVERRRFEFNRHLTWFVPPIRSSRWNPLLEVDPETAVLPGVDGARWDATVRSALHEIHRSNVGRAVISSLHRRTTIYHVANTAQTFPDCWEDADGVAAREDNAVFNQRAQREPTPAVITVDILQTPPPAGTTPQTREGRLLHELAHAVNITWGAFMTQPGWDASMQHRYGSTSDEETMAWMIENMWRGERGLPYRSSYLESRPLDRPPTDASTGYPVSTFERAAVAYYQHRVPILASRLWQLPASTTPYNPFRDSDR